MTYSTYRYRCRCGELSPRFDSRVSSRAWHARHAREECVARRSAPTTHARPADPELPHLLAQTRRYKPIPVYKEVPPKDWQDNSRDRWGARARGPQLLGKQWRGGNCLRACVASILNAPIERVPDPTVEFNEGLPGWLDRYDATVQKATGFRLERLPRSVCPPKNPNTIWIAGIRMDGPDDHVVCARGHYVVFDPLGEFMGSLPWERVIDGMILASTTRAVKVLSPLGTRYGMVPA